MHEANLSAGLTCSDGCQMIGRGRVEAVCGVEHEEAAVREEEGHVAEGVHQEEHGREEESGQPG